MKLHPTDCSPTRIASLTLLGAFVLGSTAAAAQEPVASPRTVIATAGEHYKVGALRRLLLGRHYRDLWTAPMEVQVLDLDAFAGGLHPLRTGGGRQTRSLRFLGADGREYSFRSVDKDPSPVLDSLLRETFIDDLVQDGISAAHPLGALVAAPLLEAAGILHVDPQLRVMPDAPILGEYREEFAGMLGLIEERPDENEGGRTSFQGADRVISSETLTERLDKDPDNRVDAEAFLTARLMDVFLGDWDRHRGQWRWASYQEEDPRSWEPVPTDRDQAFSKFDGIGPRLVSLYMPQFVRFEKDYPSIVRLHWNGRALDRWFLSELERPVWDSIGAALQERITDAVIDEAVGQLPKEIQALNADDLAPALRARRDRLNEAWDEFYRLLADEVDVHATATDEVVDVDRTQPGAVRIRVTAPGHGDGPYFDRTFRPDETREVRVYLKGGDDRVVVRGSENRRMILRFIGGPGDDTFAVDGSAEGLRLYDSRGNNTVTGPAELDESSFDQWVWSEEDRDQPRDWGRKTAPVLWTTYSSDLGMFVGGGVHLEAFAFRKRPYAAALNLRGGFSPTQQKGRLEFDGRLYRANSSFFTGFSARFSGLDVINYYGVGNNAPKLEGDYRKVDMSSIELRTMLGLDLASGLTLSAGVVLSRTDTNANTGRYFAMLRDSLYGAVDFRRFGASVRVEYDPFRASDAAASRVRFTAGGTTFPSYFTDVERSFAKADAGFSALLASSPYPRIALALRGGTQFVWGRFPWNEAAFLGGASTIRGWDEQRFAGDAAVFMSGEVRLRLGRPRVVVPVGMGAFAFADAGRVYLNGDSPGGWHGSVGGGIWLQPTGHSHIVRWGFGRSVEATRVYLAVGLPY